jgi:hypothetical protein
MACVWHMQAASPATSTPLGVSSSSSVLQGASFLPSMSPPVRHAATFATPPLSHPHATSPFGAKSFSGHETGNSSSTHVGHSFMGLPRKVSVYDRSGAYVMACDCAHQCPCVICSVCPVTVCAQVWARPCCMRQVTRVSLWTLGCLWRTLSCREICAYTGNMLITDLIAVTLNYFQTQNHCRTQQTSVVAARARRERRGFVAIGTIICGGHCASQCHTAARRYPVRRKAAASRVESI